MKFNLKKGKKGDNDLRLLICTDGYEQITYKDLFKIIKLFYANEDRIYPPPKFKGSKMLFEAFEYLRGHNVDEALLKFQLRKAENIHDFM